MDAKSNFLFYSNKCQMCNSLLVLFKNNNMLSYFKCICIDDERVRRQLPSTIKRVPTIIIPSMNKQLVADEIFIWLQNLKQSRNQYANTEMQMENNQQPEKKEIRTGHKRQEDIPKPPQIINQTGCIQPLAFIAQEMSGLSDTYAYTTIDQAPRHTYLSCSDLDKNTIFTAPPEDEQKIKLTKHRSYITELSKKREEQDQSINEIVGKQIQNIDYIKQKQLDAERVINKIVERQQQNIVSTYN